jgi:alkaline phosphatase D
MYKKMVFSCHLVLIKKINSSALLTGIAFLRLIQPGLLFPLLVFYFSSCNRESVNVHYNFDNIPERIWIGEDFWTVPLEDWKVDNGRVECHSAIQNASLSLLPWYMSEKMSEFAVSFNMGLIAAGENPGSSGISIGVKDDLDPDVRAAVYFGNGLNMGVNTTGFAFLGQQVLELPGGFDFAAFRVELTGEVVNRKYLINMHILDKMGNFLLTMSQEVDGNLNGIIQFINNFRTIDSADDGPAFWFDNISLSGNKFQEKPENRFGPVLWTMHTLSNNILKLSAQLPPLGTSDNKEVSFQIKDGMKWRTLLIQRSIMMHAWACSDWRSGIQVLM